MVLIHYKHLIDSFCCPNDDILISAHYQRANIVKQNFGASFG